MSNKIRNKIRRLNEDIKQVKESIERAEFAKKTHFANRLKMILRDKEEKIKRLISQPD